MYQTNLLEMGITLSWKYFIKWNIFNRKSKEISLWIEDNPVMYLTSEWSYFCRIKETSRSVKIISQRVFKSVQYYISSFPLPSENVWVLFEAKD